MAPIALATAWESARPGRWCRKNVPRPIEYLHLMMFALMLGARVERCEGLDRNEGGEGGKKLGGTRGRGGEKRSGLSL